MRILMTSRSFLHTSVLRQRGWSFTSVVLLIALLILIVVPTLQVIPTIAEYYEIQHGVNKAAKEATDTQEAKEIFTKHVVVNNIQSVTAENLTIENRSGVLKISFAYEREISLAGPVYLLIKYRGRSS